MEERRRLHRKFILRIYIQGGGGGSRQVGATRGGGEFLEHDEVQGATDHNFVSSSDGYPPLSLIFQIVELIPSQEAGWQTHISLQALQ